MKLKATQLRKDIYKLLDYILTTGLTIEVERKGQLLKIEKVGAHQGRLDKFKPMRGLIKGDPSALEKIDWSKAWKP